jgi:Ca2+-dependent lipid-binding protein
VLTGSILVFPEQVKASECLSVQLWDSDRLTADDMVGKIEFDLHDLILNSGKMESRSDKLAGNTEGSKMPGLLHWEVGYFEKADFNKKMQTHGQDIRLPKEYATRWRVNGRLRDKPEFKDPQGQLNNQTEADAVHTPPDPTLPSGIVSIIVHQIVNLEIEDITGSYKNNREFAPGQDTGENKDEEGKHLPSAYCTILLNDQLVHPLIPD